MSNAEFSSETDELVLAKEYRYKYINVPASLQTLQNEPTGSQFLMHAIKLIDESGRAVVVFPVADLLRLVGRKPGSAAKWAYKKGQAYSVRVKGGRHTPTMFRMKFIVTDMYCVALDGVDVFLRQYLLSKEYMFLKDIAADLMQQFQTYTEQYDALAKCPFCTRGMPSTHCLNAVIDKLLKTSTARLQLTPSATAAPATVAAPQQEEEEKEKEEAEQKNEATNNDKDEVIDTEAIEGFIWSVMNSPPRKAMTDDDPNPIWDPLFIPVPESIHMSLQ